MKLEHASWMEVKKYLDKPRGILLPIGSTEQHGPIGLIGTDTICSSIVADGVSEKTRMYVAPKISYTPAEFNMKFAGTVSISVEIFKGLIREVIISLLKHGFKFVYIINGHGANIEPIKELIKKANNYNIFIKSWWDFPEVNLLRKKFFGEWEGMHATPSEISITQINNRIIKNKIYSSFAKNPPKKLSAQFIKEHSGDKHGSPDEHYSLFPDGRVGSHSALANPKQGKLLLNSSIKEIIKDIKIIEKSIH